MADKYKETTFSSMLLTICLETITRKVVFLQKLSVWPLCVQLTEQSEKYLWS